MGSTSTVLKFLSLAIICAVMIDGGVCHEEGKGPTTSEYSRRSLISEHHLSSCLNLPNIDVHMWQNVDRIQNYSIAYFI